MSFFIFVIRQISDKHNLHLKTDLGQIFIDLTMMKCLVKQSGILIHKSNLAELLSFLQRLQCNQVN